MSKKKLKEILAYTYYFNGENPAKDDLSIFGSEKKVLENINDNGFQDDELIMYKVTLTPIKKLKYKMSEEKL